MPQVDPKFTFWFGVWTNVLMLVAGYSIEHAPPLVAQYAPDVQWLAGFSAKINSVILTTLIGLSSNKLGPLVNIPSSMIKPIVVLAVILTGLFAFAPDASAQTRKPINLDPLGLTSSSKASAALDNVGETLAKPFQDIAAFIGDDAEGAVSLATIIPALQDGHGQQCWMAMKQFGDVIKAHPVPATLHVIQDYETIRLLGMATNNLCSNVHCTQVFADATAMAQAASPMPLAIPSLHDLCTKVPQIAVVAPVEIPPAAVTAPPSK